MLKVKRFVLFILFVVFSLSINAQSSMFNIKIGAFYPQLDSMLWEQNLQELVMEKQDMDDMFFSFEYEYMLNKNSSLSLEFCSFDREFNTFYRDLQFIDGSDIYNSIGLKFSAYELSYKFYPLGINSKLYPYAGLGIGLYSWTYEQWGDFVNNDGTVDNEAYVVSDAIDFGFNFKIGAVFRVKRFFGILAECKYQYLKGKLSNNFEGFDKLDLRGVAISFGGVFYW